MRRLRPASAQHSVLLIMGLPAPAGGMGCSAGMISIDLAKKLLRVSAGQSCTGCCDIGLNGGQVWRRTTAAVGSGQPATGCCLHTSRNLCWAPASAGARTGRLCPGGVHRKHHAELVGRAEGQGQASVGSCGRSGAGAGLAWSGSCLEQGGQRCLGNVILVDLVLMLLVKATWPLGLGCLTSVPLPLAVPGAGTTALSAPCSSPTPSSGGAQHRSCAAGSPAACSVVAASRHRHTDQAAHLACDGTRMCRNRH